MIRNKIGVFAGTMILMQAAMGQNLTNPVMETALPANGTQEIAISSADLQTAVSAEVKAKNKNPLTNVQRMSNQQAAVYAGLAQGGYVPMTAPVPATFGKQPTSSMFDFLASGDSAEVWATMNANGMPYLFANAFGTAEATGNATWKAKVAIPAGYQKLYVRLTIPKVSVGGAAEQDAPARWQARFLAELSLNGYPVWNSEAIRTCLLKDNPKQNIPEKGSWTSLYGSPVVVNNNVAAANKEVTLLLGTFTAGQVVDLMFTSRMDAKVLGACEYKLDPNTGKMRYFCTRGTAAMEWDSTASPVRFFVGQ